MRPTPPNGLEEYVATIQPNNGLVLVRNALVLVCSDSLPLLCFKLNCCTRHRAAECNLGRAALQSATFARSIVVIARRWSLVAVAVARRLIVRSNEASFAFWARGSVCGPGWAKNIRLGWAQIEQFARSRYTTEVVWSLVIKVARTSTYCISRILPTYSVCSSSSSTNLYEFQLYVKIIIQFY